MAKTKDDPMASTHFAAVHQVGAFAKGEVFSAAQIRKAFGRDKDATPEEHEKYLAAQLKRLLDLGAITPAEAPEPETADEPVPPTFANPPAPTPTPKK